MHPKNLSINNFTYHLPDEKIALHPLQQRDDSKLLIYKNGIIQQDIYKNIHQHLPQNSLLIFNNTKVIQARILFTKPTGGVIEIFCLEPYEAINDYASVMSKKEKVRWKCMIGGAGKWKEGDLEKQFVTGNGQSAIKAKLIEKLSDAYVVEFSWVPAELSFAEILEECGNIPLPPYIKRKPEAEDKKRYQTIYAEYKGSVAAPTAGLHFTEAIFYFFTNKKYKNRFCYTACGCRHF